MFIFADAALGWRQPAATTAAYATGAAAADATVTAFTAASANYKLLLPTTPSGGRASWSRAGRSWARSWRPPPGRRCRETPRG